MSDEQDNNSKINRRGFLKKIVKGFVVTTDVVAGGIFTRLSLNTFAYAKTQFLPKKNEDALAIYFGDTSFKGLNLNKSDFFERYLKQLYVSRVELAVGTRAKKVYYEAKKNNFLEDLLDSTIQNMAFFGHGGSLSMRFLDGDLVSWDILPYLKNVVKNEKVDDSVINFLSGKTKILKRGYLFKYSCGSDFYRIIGDDIFDSDKIVKWDRVALPPEYLIWPYG